MTRAKQKGKKPGGGGAAFHRQVRLRWIDCWNGIGLGHRMGALVAWWDGMGLSRLCVFLCAGAWP